MCTHLASYQSGLSIISPGKRMRSATRELGGLKVLSLSSVPSGSWGQQGLTPVSALSSDPSRPEPLLADQMEPEMERDHRQS